MRWQAALNRIGWTMALSLAALAALAQEPGPYEGEAAVASQSEADRKAALPAALGQVLVKRTGDPAAAADPQLVPLLEQAERWLVQYRYRQTAATVDGLPQSRNTLIARFDALGVDRALAEAGRPIWPEPRPQPLVWLAIDDGRGPRLLGSAQAGVVAALTARAQQRGLRLTYPLLDLEDQRALDAAQVWANDTAAAQRASARYQSGVLLLGRLYRQGSGWEADWQVIHDGQSLARERSTDADSAVVLAAGADLAARALRERYLADLASAGEAGRYRVRVDGVRSALDYARLIGQLQRLSTVHSLHIVATEGDSLLLDLDLAAGIGGFSRGVTGIGLLRAADDPEASALTLSDSPQRFLLLP
ncbi:MAG: DUF2066 domain-containing protein [Lysobacteraceae bacterium]